MLSTVVAEIVEAGRIDRNAAGLAAVRRAVRANIVMDGWTQMED